MVNNYDLAITYLPLEQVPLHGFEKCWQNPAKYLVISYCISAMVIASREFEIFKKIE